MPELRTALVTGASSGFGLLTAVTLARRDWRVLATMRDLNRRERLETAAREAGVLDRIEFYPLDVTSPDQITALAAGFAARPVNAIVNNAGFALPGFAKMLPTRNCAGNWTPTSSAQPRSPVPSCPSFAARDLDTSSWLRPSPAHGLSRTGQLRRFQICARRLD